MCQGEFITTPGAGFLSIVNKMTCKLGNFFISEHSLKSQSHIYYKTSLVKLRLTPLEWQLYIYCGSQVISNPFYVPEASSTLKRFLVELRVTIFVSARSNQEQTLKPINSSLYERTSLL